MPIPSQTVRHIHFIGIGGIGMSGIAEVMHNLGYIITGSDLVENANVQRLRKAGITVHIGHASSNVGLAQVLVISSDIKQQDNPEIVEARRRRVPIIRRAEMLAELMHLRHSVAISGTHGKTTTTSLMAALFDAANLDPTVINGGIINAYGTNARLGTGEWMVVEADESDGSFLRLPATIAVVTNIDPDHMDYYGSFETLKRAFHTFIERLPFYGLAVLCVDHPVVRQLAETILDRRIITYGFSEGANIRAVNLRETPEGTRFDVEILDNDSLRHSTLSKGKISLLPKMLKDLFLPMMGRHNVQNCLSTIAVAQELSIGEESIRKSLGEFSGVKRRFTKVAQVHGVTIIDDYAHHPVEIKTVLEAAKQACGGKIIAVVEPHRFSRVRELFQDYVETLSLSDTLVLTPIYPAGEPPLEGITSSALAEAIMHQSPNKPTVSTLYTQEELASFLITATQPGDIVVCMGAGAITHWAAALPDLMEASSPSSLNFIEKKSEVA